MWTLKFSLGSSSLTSRACSTNQCIRIINHNGRRQTRATMALGEGLDMSTGNLGGGITATIIDVAMSFAATKAYGAPSSIKLDLEFKQPISTPCVLICIVHVTKREGRRRFTQCTVEGEKGNVFASATSIFDRHQVRRASV